MAKPKLDLADIVLPVAPPPVPSSNVWMWVVIVLAAFVAGEALFWLWRRHAARRELQRIFCAIERQPHELSVLATRLDGLLRRHFRLNRIAADLCPAGIENPLWANWVVSLKQVRFDKPQAGHPDQLVDLCRTAREWLQPG